MTPDPFLLSIIGARPSVGKTSAALGMALAATQANMPAVFVTLEQSQIDIANRLLCAMTALPFADIELDRLADPIDRERLADAENQLANLPRWRNFARPFERQRRKRKSASITGSPRFDFTGKIWWPLARPRSIVRSIS